MWTDEEINTIGNILEDEGLSHSEIDAYFEHHGVKGQKWGLRKGKSATGYSRRRGAVIDRNKKVIGKIQKAQSGEKYKITAAVGRLFVGKEQQKINWNHSIKSLGAQNKRLASGKVHATDRMAVYRTVSLFNMTFAKTDRNPTGVPHNQAKATANKEFVSATVSRENKRKAAGAPKFTRQQDRAYFKAAGQKHDQRVQQLRNGT